MGASETVNVQITKYSNSSSRTAGIFALDRSMNKDGARGLNGDPLQRSLLKQEEGRNIGEQQYGGRQTPGTLGLEGYKKIWHNNQTLHKR